MAENDVANPSIETVKRLLLEDLNRTSAFDKILRESTFCEVDDEVPAVSAKLLINLVPAVS